MDKKSKVSKKQGVEKELHDFALSGIGLIIVGVIYFFIYGANWLNISIALLGVLMLAIRTKGMIIFVGLLELLFGIYLFILFSLGESYTLGSALFVIIIGIFIMIMGIIDIQRYYRIKD